MEYIITILVIGALGVVALLYHLHCNHYYGVPYQIQGEILQVCYKCGRIRKVKSEK